MKKMLQRNWLLPGIIIGLFLLLNLLIWRQLLHQINTDKVESINSGKLQNRNLVATLEQYTVRILKDADAALQLVRKEFQEDGKNFKLDSLLNRGVADFKFVHGLAIADKNGNILDVYPNNLPKSFTVKDRPAFIYQKNSTADSLYISKPVISRTINKPVILLSRKIFSKSNEFLGAVMLQIEPEQFTSFYADANMERNELLSLISLDGISYSRRRENIQSSGDDIRKGKLLSMVKKSLTGDYYTYEIQTGIPTFFSYRVLKNYPIIATSGRTEKSILADFYEREKNTYQFGIVITFLLLLFFGSIYYFIQQRKRDERKLTMQIIAAQEKEREVIGHELHDNINQILTASKLHLQFTNDKLKDSNIETSIDYLQTAINEIRNISRSLSAPTLGSKSLTESISLLIQNLKGIINLEFNFEYSTYEHELNKEQALAMYRIIQEQINNIIKHAGATKVNISLAQDNKVTILNISDNGKGFDTRVKRNGIGLNNILSRSQVFNGKMAIYSSPGKGTKLEVILPFHYPTDSTI